MGAYVDQIKVWLEGFNKTFIETAQIFEDASIHAGLANSILVGLLDNDTKKEFFVPDELIEEFKAYKSLSITCHGTNENGMVHYVVEVQDRLEKESCESESQAQTED